MMKRALLSAARSQRVIPSLGRNFHSTSRVANIKNDLDNEALVSEVTKAQVNAAQKVVPWFVDQMPRSYFERVDPETIKEHMKVVSAIMALNQPNLNIEMKSQKDKGELVTFIKTSDEPGQLLAEVEKLPQLASPGLILKNLSSFSAADGKLALNMYTVEQGDESKNIKIDNAIRTKAINRIMDYIHVGRTLPESDSGLDMHDPIFSDEAMAEYFDRCGNAYLDNPNIPVRRFLRQRALFNSVCAKSNNYDGTAIETSPYTGDELPGTTNPRWITLAASNVPCKSVLTRSLRILKNHGVNAHRAHLNVVTDDEVIKGYPTANFVSMLRLIVSGDAVDDKNSLAQILKDIKSCKYYSDDVLDLYESHPEQGTGAAEVLTTLCKLMVGPLSKSSGTEFGSFAAVLGTLRQNPAYMALAFDITKLFMAKFDPSNPLSAEAYDAMEAKIQTAIQEECEHNPTQIAVMDCMLNAVRCTLRTNFFMPEKFALMLRLDPIFMHPNPTPQRPLPYGVFFASGRSFTGFHCRFRDIARGGLRLVTPSSTEQLAMESTRHFDEVYGLSLGQQLKNKDIPEGGSKGVLLIDTIGYDEVSKIHTMRRSVKFFTDAILDLSTDESVNGPHMVDYFGKEELIYLGPDEQCIPGDTDYICARAAARGYPIPAAFMSSKAEAGFNHKEFGVTSEGVHVYLKVALKELLGIDPATQPFTVKITGGPDGDVGGNLIRLLIEEFPNTVKILGVADGMGVAEDPEGLDHKELLRLFVEALPISEFNSSALSSSGILMDCSTKEGVDRRNSMHNRVKADAFVPAGGRPFTITIDNYKEFFDENGVPSSPLIVEGANIFITPEARAALFADGKVAIIKDSSANKCGVITSSCEIMASMVLAKDEFMANKQELVADVLDKIKLAAEMEAELLIREYNNYPGELPFVSERISNAINHVTDVVNARIEAEPTDSPLYQELLPLVKDCLPKKLADLAWDRVPTSFPVPYQKATISMMLGSRLVYTEGVGYVEAQYGLADEKLADRVIEHYRTKQRVNALIADVESGKASAETHAEVVRLLKIGGTRSKLGIY